MILLDDIHWADRASARTLRMVLDDPAGPPVLLVATERAEERVAVERVATGLVATGLVTAGRGFADLSAIEEVATSEAVDELMRLADSEHVELREHALPPLSWSEARQLVLPTIGDDGRDSRILARAKALFRDSGGNPLHLCELLRAQVSELDAELDLDELIAGRLTTLDAELRRALSFAALANGPIDRAVIQCTGCTDADLDALLDAELLWLPDHDVGLVEITHGRIREAVLGELDSEVLPQLHLELAHALAVHDADAELVADHFEKGGEPELALEFGLRAAQAAMGTLAFARAATWFERCLLWLDFDSSLRVEIQRALAEAYANAGRLVDAAWILRALAGECGGTTGGLALRSKAVEYLLKSGRVHEGMREVEAVLEAVELELPSGDAQLLTAAVSYRWRLGRHLAQFSPRPPSDAEVRLRTQVQTCATLSESLAAHEPLLSLYFLQRWRGLAVELGAPVMFGRALGIDAVVSSSLGQPERARELLAVARGYASEDALTELRLALAGASVEAHADNWGLAASSAESTLSALGGRPELQWEQRVAADVLSWAKIEVGDYRDAIARMRRALQAALDVGDVKQIRDSAGLLCWALVGAGELDEAQRVFEDIRARERDADGERYPFAELFRDVAWVRWLLRTGRAAEALVAAQQMPATMRELNLWRLPSYRHAALALIAQATLHAFSREPTARRRRKLRALTRKLRRQSRHHQGNAALIEAWVLNFDGDVAGARAALAEAERCFVDSGAEANLAAARVRLAQVSEGDEAMRLLAEATAYFVAQDVRRPDELVASLAGPGRGPM